MRDAGSDREYWFPAKRFGLGWGPPTRWQGWAVIGGYVVLLSLLSLVLARGEHELLFGFGVFVLTGALIAVCWIKGERPGWRWGGDKRLP